MAVLPCMPFLGEVASNACSRSLGIYRFPEGQFPRRVGCSKVMRQRGKGRHWKRKMPAAPSPHYASFSLFLNHSKTSLLASYSLTLFSTAPLLLLLPGKKADRTLSLLEIEDRTSARLHCLRQKCGQNVYARTLLQAKRGALMLAAALRSTRNAQYKAMVATW